MPYSVPTFVWFDFIESFNRNFPQKLYFSSELGRHVMFGTLRNREIDLLGFGRNDRRIGDINDTVSQMIKSTPECSENIRSDERNLQRCG